MDPFIRSLVGELPPLGLSLEMELLRLDAISPKNAVPLFEIEPNKIKEIPELIEAEHLEVTKDFKMYLTELGWMIAKGAIKIYE